MKIIFLTESEHFTIKNYNDLYVKFLSNEFEYEIWDCLELNETRKKQFENIIVPNRIIEAKQIKDFNEFSNRIFELNDVPIIVTQYFTNKKIYDFINSMGGYIFEINKVSFHILMRRKAQFKKQIFDIIHEFRKVSLRITNKKKFETNNPILIDYSFNSLKISEVRVNKYIKMHHIKYDDYTEIKNQPPLIKKKYFVFIDLFLPYISDFVHKGGSVDPIEYYSSLNNFFDNIEKRYECEVIIAPHPKANYDNKVFNGRRIIEGSTTNLICNSIGVISHDSTSNITAVLARKPLIFVYLNSIKKTPAKRVYYTTKKMANLLGSPFIDLNNVKKIKLKLNKRKYKVFEYKYIINSKLINKSNSQIIIDFLNKIEIKSRIVKKNVKNEK